MQCSTLLRYLFLVTIAGSECNLCVNTVTNFKMDVHTFRLHGSYTVHTCSVVCKIV